MLLLGFNALQEEVLNAQLNGGKQSKHGLILNALMTGVVESFQGKYFGNNEAANVWTISAGASIDKDLEPYYLQGSSQEFAVRVSDTTAVTTAGILDASVAGDRGYLRLSLRDVNGKAAMALTQENVRWIAPLTSFTAVFDIAKWTTSAYGKTISFFEIGVMGTQGTIANITDAAKEPGDGNPFIAVQFSSNTGILRVRSAASATVVTGSSFVLPDPSTQAFTVRIEYKYNPKTASGYSILFVNDQKIGGVPGMVTGPFQIFVRACHGASYVAATHTPIVVDVDSIICSVPRS